MHAPKALLSLGYIPGNEETKENFFKRISCTRSILHGSKPDLDISLPKGKTLPLHHWDWASKEIEAVYGIAPSEMVAFYDNQKLSPWQGGATWIVDLNNIRFSYIRLNKTLRKKKLFNLYSREEVLAHEAVHAMRVGFSDSPYEELFAYLVSSSSLRRIFGPILQRPWEAYLFLLPFAFLPITPLLSPIYFSAFISFFSLLLTVALFRLFFLRLRFFRLMKKIQKWTKSQKKALQLMLFLSGDELSSLSKCKTEKLPQELRAMVGSFRWEFSFQRYFEKENPKTS